jgi:hypothetical protein
MTKYDLYCVFWKLSREGVECDQQEGEAKFVDVRKKSSALQVLIQLIPYHCMSIWGSLAICSNHSEHCLHCQAELH